MTVDSIVPGRSCGTCSLCCKLLKVVELSKPRGIVIGEFFENGRVKYRVVKMRADDPRLAGAEVGKLHGSHKNLHS